MALRVAFDPLLKLCMSFLVSLAHCCRSVKLAHYLVYTTFHIFNITQHLAGRLVTVNVCAVRPVLEPLDVLLVCFNLGGHRFVRVGTDRAAEWRILHYSQVVEDLSCLRWITRLGTMPVSCNFPWVDVIVCVVLDFAELHAATGPVSSEATGLNAGQLDPPLGLQLLRQCFCESFDSPLGRAVDGEGRHAYSISQLYLEIIQSCSPI